MTPRTDMVAVSLNSSFDEARETIVRAGHTRVPVYQDSRDHIVGVLYAKDLLQAPSGEGFEVQKVMRAAQYVPESKPIDQLLRDLRQARVHIAIVLDEYGGTAGLVTIEDILEELVGEIDDEYDRGEAPFIRKVDEDTVEADARVHVYEINEQLAIELPEGGDYETIGGFVFSAMGKIPAAGDELTHENVHIAILAAEPRRINRVRVHVERQAVSA
jgi:CBS domain containing-hemolysin-like protein